MLKFCSVLTCFVLTIGGLNAKSPNPVTPDSSRSSSVIYVFEGSDWCVNCLRFKNKVLHDSVFLAALDSSHTRLEFLDFPQRKKLAEQTVNYNMKMSEKLGFNGDFPTIVIYSLKSDKFRSLPYKNEEVPEFLRNLYAELKSLDE